MIIAIKVMKGTLLKLALMLSVVFVVSCEEYLPDGELFAKEYLPSGELRGHAYVDLGLPSGTKWATCNVDASAHEEYGGYYAWGETEEKSIYEWSTYKWCNGSSNTLTKYCASSSYGVIDRKTVLDPEDDVAHVKWGGSWRMPTLDEQNELFNDCFWTWTTQNGVNGYKVTSKTNGNSIFLPATGYRNGTGVYDRGSRGNLWLSSLIYGDSNLAHVLGFYNDGRDGSDWSGHRSRYYGFPVRPVCGGVKYTVSVSKGDGGSVEIKSGNGLSIAFEKYSTVTVVAKPNEGYAFSGWYVGNALVSSDAEYAFTVCKDVALVAKFKNLEINGHAYVDLGLPSGLKWATCNVGASAPEEYGGYYAWGETEENEYYGWSTYKWCKGSNDTMTKYCTSSSYGTVDNKTVLDPEDDVAHVKWGGTWRMPTLDEQKELLDNCTWDWTTQNSVNGYKVIGSNGNSIFLPAAGYRDGKGVSLVRCVRYWSSSLSSGNSAYYLGFDGGDRDCYNYDRYYGYPVRPVSD